MLRVAEHYAATDTGRQRRANEDSLLARSPLFVVADGMGGAQAGEVASRLAVEVFGEPGSDFSDPARALVEYAEAANSRIHELAHADADHAGMGTTVTAAYVGEHEVTVAHVGDSRAYCLRDGTLMRLTDDHSLVDELIRQGRLTPEEAEEHPQRSIITRALGPEPSVEVDTRVFVARAGDVYLLCSDGLTSMLGEPEIERLVVAHRPLPEAGEALIEAANAAGGRDNITVLLLRLEEVGVDGAGPQAPAEHTTIITPPPQQARRDGSHSAASASALAVAPARRRVPRPAQRTTAAATARSPARRRLRRAAVPTTLLAILAMVAAGAYLALQSVFFIGTDSNGLITVYRGVPYVLPGGIDLYSPEYVSGVSASTIAPQRRRTLLSHALRTEENAGELVRRLELGQLSGR